MNQTNTALEFSNATRRILRWRIPLFFALIANIAILARLAFVPAGAAASQPETASASLANRSAALQPSDSDPANPTGRSSASATTATSDLATHALSAPEMDVKAMVSDYLPDVSDLASRWWPAIESAAEAAARLAATQQPPAQQPRLGHLSIGNVQQNGVPVSFVLDGRVYTLHPGESHQFPVGTSWNIQFHRGGAFGNASEPLTSGEYQFVVGPDGWVLRPAR